MNRRLDKAAIVETMPGRDGITYLVELLRSGNLLPSIGDKRYMDEYLQKPGTFSAMKPGDKAPYTYVKYINEY